MLRFVIFPTVSLLLLAGVAAQQQLQQQHRGFDVEEMVGVDCLGCICEATTGCNLQFNCTHGLCGPLLISQNYWIDAGRCTLEGDNPAWTGAHYRCVTDAYCAAYVVRNYMARYAQDCNGDGRVDCEDFARIHYLGAFRCTQPIERTPYMRVFNECRSATSQLNG